MKTTFKLFGYTFIFWYTDLSPDCGQPWFATHLSIWRPGRTTWETRRMTTNLRMWKINLLFSKFKRR